MPYLDIVDALEDLESVSGACDAHLFEFVMRESNQGLAVDTMF